MALAAVLAWAGSRVAAWLLLTGRGHRRRRPRGGWRVPRHLPITGVTWGPGVTSSNFPYGERTQFWCFALKRPQMRLGRPAVWLVTPAGLVTPAWHRAEGAGGTRLPPRQATCRSRGTAHGDASRTMPGLPEPSGHGGAFGDSPVTSCPAARVLPCPAGPSARPRLRTLHNRDIVWAGGGFCMKKPDFVTTTGPLCARGPPGAWRGVGCGTG